MRHLLICCLLLGATTAHAQNEVLPPVRTELKRDGSALPYGRINGLLGKLRAHGEGLFRMDFKVDAEKTKLPLSHIRLAVRSDDADHPITLGPDGSFDLPVLPEAEARTADLATNAPKGQMTVRGTLALTVAPDRLDLATVRRLMRVAHTLREELLPFYLRWLFPRPQAVRVCSATPTWELEWRENGQLLGLKLPPVAAERDPEAKKGDPARPCTLLTGQENWPDAARLLPPPGSTLSLKL